MCCVSVTVLVIEKKIHYKLYYKHSLSTFGFLINNIKNFSCIQQTHLLSSNSRDLCIQGHLEKEKTHINKNQSIIIFDLFVTIMKRWLFLTRPMAFRIQ